MHTLPSASLTLPHATPSVSIPLAFALLIGALGIDWAGIGDQWYRDRYAAVLAVPGWCGLLAGAGWDDLAAGHAQGWGLGSTVAAAAGLAVTLLGGKRTPGRISLPLWACTLTIALCLPATGRPVARALAWPWGSGDPALAGACLGAFTAAWLAAAGWRPHRIAIHSPAWLAWLRDRANPQVEVDSDSDSDSESGRDSGVRSWPLLAVVRDGDQPVAMVSDRPVATGGRLTTAWSWGSWWSRMWSWSAPEARVSDLPLDVPPATAAERWIARQLDREASPTEIVRVARRHWRMSEATAWRRIRKIRRDRGIGA